MPKTKSNQQAALLSIEKVLTLLRSVQTLEGTDKDGVEHLLDMDSHGPKEVNCAFLILVLMNRVA
jgi:hypothetical protein